MTRQSPSIAQRNPTLPAALSGVLPLRELLVRELRAFRPDAVLTHDPDVVVYGRGGINHTDHRAAGTAAVRG